ncbi:hypothetical protein [Prochlorococcus marinus]|uniref:hypothetical protein n=1 Tax=Prochlorococcus marinus TaxID=1219 RepID=UPI0022B5227B|nr:hypothetical protein [Prochlorococcus marinus]
MNAKGKSQLNIKVDPKLLLRLKSEAIKNGKTLAAFITELLEQGSIKPTAHIDILEKRLLIVEQKLNSLGGLLSDKEKDLNTSESIFSNKGAKKYGEIARELFELHRKEKKLSLKDAFSELSTCLSNYDSQPELVFEILSGNHELTGLEMTDAYRNGSCGMRSALSEWINSPLEPLNEAFLNAVEVANLV